MSKIGIATITILVNNENAYNYGNKLQMYALQEYLRSLGHDCCTIRYRFTPPDISPTNNKSLKRNSLVQNIDDSIRIIMRKVFAKKLSKCQSLRRKKFNDFIERHVVLSDKIYDAGSNFEILNNEFDYFITGSDQVWNPYCEGSNEFYYLTFAPEYKRIAYAPSIAVESIPDEYIRRYKEWIGNIPFVSVREDVGKRLVESIVEKQVKLVCDPVFLLDRNQWSKLAKTPKMSSKYFVSYFLGKKTVYIKRQLRRLEKKYGMKCIDVYTKDSITSSFCGPEEFIGLIENAEFICTDSFHGTAFATIFNTPMVIFERGGINKMNSRIDSLLRLIGCSNRSIDDIMSGNSDANFALIDQGGELKKLIEESKEYLALALAKGEKQWM